MPIQSPVCHSVCEKAPGLDAKVGRPVQSRFARKQAYPGLTRMRNSDDLSDERCRLRVICTVVSTPTPGRIIIDGGMKTFCRYPSTPYGHCIEYPEIKLYSMSVEHGHVDVSQSTTNSKWRTADLDFITPRGRLVNRSWCRMVA